MFALQAAVAPFGANGGWEDGNQGYTPYFYKMDEPVRVRVSVSYGRA